MKTLLGLTFAAMIAATPAFAHGAEKEKLASDETTKVSGEVLDLACYIDHGATGDKHEGCAEKCIEGGLPVGLKGDDGKTYLLIGEHVPLNKELAQHAGKKITVEGKVASRDGINLIENAVVQK